jgi:hypothetical protein
MALEERRICIIYSVKGLIRLIYIPSLMHYFIDQHGTENCVSESAPINRCGMRYSTACGLASAFVVA